MLNKKVVTEFLGRPRDNHTWIKQLSDEELDKELSLLSPQPTFSAPLLKHQKVAFLIGLAFNFFFFQYEMGLGKSRICLELISYLLKTTPNHLFLVLAPTDEVVEGWQEEVEKWTPYVETHLLLGTRDEKWYNLSQAKSGVVVGTYIGIATLVSDLVSVQDKKGKWKQEWQPNRELLAQLCERLTGVIYDESTKVANRGTLSFNVADAISRATKFRYALAGRAFGRDPMPLWGQFYLVDRGETLSPSLGLFRETFFIKKASRWGGPFHFDYKFDRRLSNDLARITGHRSIQYLVSECDRLPDLVRIKKSVRFPSENEAYYKKIIKQIIAAKGNIREVKNGFLRLRQLSSGFLGLIDDETEERVEIVFKNNVKLNLLMELIDEVPDTSKIAVFHEYNFSGKQICRALTEAKIEHGWLHGGTKDWTNLKHRLDTDPNFRVLVINHKKGAYGLNLQACNYVFIFESPVSPIDRSQMEKRSHRTGQKKKVFLYDLTVKGTVDDRILDFHREGADLFKALTTDPKKFLS